MVVYLPMTSCASSVIVGIWRSVKPFLPAITDKWLSGVTLFDIVCKKKKEIKRMFVTGVIYCIPSDLTLLKKKIPIKIEYFRYLSVTF